MINNKKKNPSIKGTTTKDAGHVHAFIINPDNSVTIYPAYHPKNKKISHNHYYIGEWPFGYVTENKSDCYPNCKEMYGVIGAPPHIHNVELTKEINLTNKHKKLPPATINRAVRDIENINDVKDFTNVGYKYGEEEIPANTCTTSQQLELGGDASNNRELIQTAIDTAQPGDTVCLPAGPYAIQGTISLNTNGVTLRGNPEGDTGLWFYEYNEDYINNIGFVEGIKIGVPDSPTTEQKLNVKLVYMSTASDFIYGDDFVTVGTGSASFLAVGDYVRIDGFLGDDFIEYYNMEEISSYSTSQLSGGWAPGWKRQAYRKIIDIQNGVIFFDIPLRYPLSSFENIRIYKLENYYTNIGISDLYLSNAIHYDDAWKKDNESSYITSNKRLITMEGCFDCFIDNVNSGTVGTDINGVNFGSSEIGVEGSSECPPPGIVTKLLEVISNQYLEEDSEWYSEYYSLSGEHACGGDWRDCIWQWDLIHQCDCRCCTDIHCTTCTGWHHNVSDGCAVVDDGSCNNPCRDYCGGEWHNVERDWYNDYSFSYPTECEHTLRMFDLVKNDFIYGVDTSNVSNENRELASSGIRLQKNKNITISNSRMGLPQNRGEGGNGYMFSIANSNEVLVENCEGYRGRHNFTTGGHGTSGIVFSKIKSEGGWGFGVGPQVFEQFGLTDAIPAQLKYFPADNALGANHGVLEHNPINEASGLIQSRNHSNVFWTHNDSGDEAIIYAFNPSGEHLGEWMLYYTLGTPENIDWEDMATDGDYIYIADIGDGGGPTHTIWKCNEPTDVPTNNQGENHGGLISCSPPIEFNYLENGEYVDYDAETFMVEKDQAGDVHMYIVTKAPMFSDEPSKVFYLDTSRGEADYLTTVGPFTTGTPTNQITGGDISADGEHVLIKTYAKVFHFTKDGFGPDSLIEALTTSEELTNYVSEPLEQGEAIAVAHDTSENYIGYYTISEEKIDNQYLINLLSDEIGSDMTNMFDVDADWWSRYGELELTSHIFGYASVSDTHKGLSTDILVTDSDIYDGWMSLNRETMSNGQGLTTTNTTFWNIRGNPNPDTEDPWKDMAVPGMSVLASFQPTAHEASPLYENGGAIIGTNSYMSVFTDTENPYNYLNYWTNSLSTFFGSEPIEEDYFNNILNIMEQFIKIPQEEYMKGLDYTSMLLDMFEPCPELHTDICDEGGDCPCYQHALAHHPAILLKSGYGLGLYIGVWGMYVGGWDIDITMCSEFNNTIDGHVCNGKTPYTFILKMDATNLHVKIAAMGVLGLTHEDDMTLDIALLEYQAELEPIGYDGTNPTSITGYVISGTTDVSLSADNWDFDCPWEFGNLFCNLGTEILVDAFGYFKELVRDSLVGMIETSVNPKVEELFNTCPGTSNYCCSTDASDECSDSYHNEYILMLISMFGSFATQSLIPVGSHENTEPSDTVELIGEANTMEIPNIYEHQITMRDVGDVNLDGYVNVVDIVNMVNYILGYLDLSDEALQNADMNGDGVVDVLDVIELADVILGQRSTRALPNVRETLTILIPSLEKLMKSDKSDKSQGKKLEGLIKRIENREEIPNKKKVNHKKSGIKKNFYGKE